MFREIAGESIEVEFKDGTFYVFGSELATLRLWMKYTGSVHARQAYSVNLGTYFFALDVPSFTGSMSEEDPDDDGSFKYLFYGEKS